MHPYLLYFLLVAAISVFQPPGQVLGAKVVGEQRIQAGLAYVVVTIA